MHPCVRDVATKHPVGCWNWGMRYEHVKATQRHAQQTPPAGTPTHQARAVAGPLWGAKPSFFPEALTLLLPPKGGCGGVAALCVCVCVCVCVSMRASKRQCCCVMCFGVVCFVVGAQLDCVSHAHEVDGVRVCVCVCV